MKRTSLGVCRREDVVVKMFSDAKYGRVEMRAMTAETKRMLREVKTGGGTGCLPTGAVSVCTF